jgi:hypothetical protein
MNAPERPLLGEAQPMLDWSERNRRWLTLQLAALRRRIEALTGTPAAGTEHDSNGPNGGPAIGGEPAVPSDNDFTSALDRCAEIFGLSPFERELLLLTAGAELDSGLRRAVAQVQSALSDGGRSLQPTFSLALRVLSQPHWDALSPLAPLRRWRLIELAARHAPAEQPLHVDERILYYLTGVASVDERLLGIARLETSTGANAASGPLGRRIAHALSDPDRRAPLVLLTQSRADHELLRDGAMQGLHTVRASGLWLYSRDLPAEPRELAETALLIDREAAIARAVIVVDLDSAADNMAELEHKAIGFIARLVGPVLLLGALDPRHFSRLAQRRIIRIAAPEPPADALQAQALQRVPAGAAEAFANALQPALRQFRPSATALHDVIDQVFLDQRTDIGDIRLAQRIWQCCRESARGGLDTLAQRVDSRARLEDIVLPRAQAQMLRDIVEHLRHRHTVYATWGMAGSISRDQGLCALFAGESGTGKTLAAEAIANEVALDLYRIDLATVVSKYIGETEKNLKRLFDAAEASGAVLLFEEADALYGKRSEVKDSHDRYANIEVAYLLQRIEAYRGLAILTTNFKSALDRAFLRRIRFVVQFPFPDEAARQQIWRRELPDSAPKGEIDYAALARMQLTGGHIRSVALNAAFIAAATGQPITMPHLRLAAQREAAKLERSISESSPRSFA